MTGYTVHTGSTEKFSEGWDRIFGGTKRKSPKKPSATEQRTAKAPKSRKKG
jgi:hypothetical protein